MALINSGGDSVFSVSDKEEQSEPVLKTERYITIYDLLKEHLKKDKIWNLLAQRERDYRENIQLRAELQREIVSVLYNQTGYPVDDGKKLSTNFIYSYTTGDLFFKSILQKSFGPRQTVDLENNMLADIASGTVRYHGSILVKCRAMKKNV